MADQTEKTAFREIINDALARLGEQKLRSDPTIKQQLDTWVRIEARTQ